MSRASSLSRTTYQRARDAERKARPGQLEGLISHAAFLKTGGKAPAGSVMAPHAGMAPAPELAGTKIKLKSQPARPRQSRKKKRR